VRPVTDDASRERQGRLHDGALYLATHAPDRVTALVLTGTNAYQSYRLPWNARLVSSWAGRLLGLVLPKRAVKRSYLKQFADPAGVDRALEQPRVFAELTDAFLGKVL
jgi:pimeloyl-ACP methyl ester carboxylesterase